MKQEKIYKYVKRNFDLKKLLKNKVDYNIKYINYCEKVLENL